MQASKRKQQTATPGSIPVPPVFLQNIVTQVPPIPLESLCASDPKHNAADRHTAPNKPHRKPVLGHLPYLSVC